MYVLPFSMGPVGSPMSQIGVELTDSPYVVVNMRIMARIGLPVYSEIDKAEKRVVPCIHSLGAPIESKDEDTPWPCNKEKYIVHFPETREIWSYGSGYGGNALLGKKCFALRIASNIARDEGWMAEHMLILGVENPPRGKDICGRCLSQRMRENKLCDAHPSGILSRQGMEGHNGWRRHSLDQTGPGWPPKGDQSGGWIFRRGARHFGEDQPERDGFAREKYDLHKRRADARGRGVVGGNDGDPPSQSIDWQGKEWTPGCGRHGVRQHPNSRFTAPASQCPSIDPNWEKPEGVPISAIVFGGRRASNIPLVYQAFNWSAGVYTGATMGSEMTAAAAGTIGKVRRDPMAMLPFCGYHMGDYFRHWILMQRILSETPRIFHVNWFRKDEEGKFMWPGFSENMGSLSGSSNGPRVTPLGQESPIGWMPRHADIEWAGLTSQRSDSKASAFKQVAWRSEVISHEELFLDLHDRLPKEMVYERNC